MDSEVRSMLLKDKPDFEYIYPIADCTECGQERPFGILCGPIDDSLLCPYYCLGCKTIVPSPKAKGYVSLLELGESEEEWYLEL